ncbi:ABC transporter ATP-binding protein [Clostridium perfringens]|uniref:ABC transporter ATP-binding protein n=1 Tax=Clostridium perfringens TaxID=1502 RepID=UPI0022480965|nr:ABC transporter ATP-binding protein [Clostridium perfringens]MCX0383245.1 ABC transporter ATP-binding protein/permease [Clostridium perfringens]
MENKEKYTSDLYIIKHFLKLAHGISKTYIPTLFFSSLFAAAVPFLNIIMPKYIIDELLGARRIKVLILLVLLTVIGNGVLNLINRVLEKKCNIKNEEVVAGFDLLIGKKVMDLDFENIEDPEILNLKERALFPIRNQGAIWQLTYNISKGLTEILKIIGLIGVILTLDWIIIALIILIVLLSSFMYKKSQRLQHKFFDSLIPLNREFGYYINTINDFSAGKDIRLYNVAPLFVKKLDEFNINSTNVFIKMFSKLGVYEGLNEIVLQLQMVIVYGYITYKVLINSIGIGDFTMYTNAAINFSKSISNLFGSYVTIRQMCRYLQAFMEFENIESKHTKEGKKIGNLEKVNIEFKNVSFKYPRSKEFTLKNVSIKINEGEKLSVVGLNGAGKTTFIKLLARLYEPTEGEILLNGVNINEYDYDEYMKLLSVVFQDFKLMSFSIKENIALNDFNKVKDEEIEEVLIKSGFGKDLEKLPKGINTPVYKNFDECGIEFSGGQAQKLAIARAVYKNAPIVILDEPTAALDPKAEYEIYSKFNELIGKKTTIYISHRLSSCRFCDNIAVFQKGKLIQYGTHDELVKDKGNEYETMYSAQAQYYI